MGLVAGSIPAVTLDQESVLVKPEVAKKQREEEAQKAAISTPYKTAGQTASGEINEVQSATATLPDFERIETPQEVVLRRFHGSVELDATRLGRDAGKISEEVLTHLISLIGAKAKIVLEIEVEVPGGIPKDKMETITENCKSLKFKSHGFEAE